MEKTNRFNIIKISSNKYSSSFKKNIIVMCFFYNKFLKVFIIFQQVICFCNLQEAPGKSISFALLQFTALQKVSQIFILMGSLNWNSLPQSLFPEKYNLGVCKSIKHLSARQTRSSINHCIAYHLWSSAGLPNNKKMEMLES